MDPPGHRGRVRGGGARGFRLARPSCFSCAAAGGAKTRRRQWRGTRVANPVSRALSDARSRSSSSIAFSCAAAALRGFRHEVAMSPRVAAASTGGILGARRASAFLLESFAACGGRRQRRVPVSSLVFLEQLVAPGAAAPPYDRRRHDARDLRRARVNRGARGAPPRPAGVPAPPPRRGSRTLSRRSFRVRLVRRPPPPPPRRRDRAAPTPPRAARAHLVDVGGRLGRGGRGAPFLGAAASRAPARPRSGPTRGTGARGGTARGRRGDVGLALRAGTTPTRARCRRGWRRRRRRRRCSEPSPFDPDSSPLGSARCLNAASARNVRQSTRVFDRR